MAAFKNEAKHTATSTISTTNNNNNNNKQCQANEIATTEAHQRYNVQNANLKQREIR